MEEQYKNLVLCSFCITPEYLHSLGIPQNETFRLFRKLIAHALEKDDVANIHRFHLMYFELTHIYYSIKLVTQIKSQQMLHAIMSQFHSPYPIVYYYYYMFGLYRKYDMPPFPRIALNAIPIAILEDKIEFIKLIKHSKKHIIMYKEMARLSGKTLAYNYFSSCVALETP